MADLERLHRQASPGRVLLFEVPLFNHRSEHLMIVLDQLALVPAALRSSSASLQRVENMFEEIVDVLPQRALAAPDHKHERFDLDCRIPGKART